MHRKFCGKYTTNSPQKQIFMQNYWIRNKQNPQKPLAVLRIRDVEGGEAGANWNERRDWYPFNGDFLLSEVQWSTGAKRTPEQARRRGPVRGRESRNAQIKKTFKQSSLANIQKIEQQSSHQELV